MFKTRKEMQSLIDACRKSLARAEETIEKLTFEYKELRELRKQEVHNNTILINENRELREKLNSIEKLATSNTYGNDKAILDKLKEVIRRKTK